MKTMPMKRVTIVSDDALGRQIIKEVHDLGATGYTYAVVHGQGEKGTRPSHWEGANAKIEIIATLDTAQRILEHVAQKYFQNYAIIAFLDDVQVLRGEKFGA